MRADVGPRAPRAVAEAARPFRRLACGLLASLLLAEAPPPPRPLRNPPNAPRTELSHPCSRLVSRNVRKQLEKEVLGPSTRAGIKAWPLNCQFDPALDLYAGQERQKQHKRGAKQPWTCGLCGKQFKSEHYLDLHLERKHMNETPRSGVCLADYCEMFEACDAGFVEGRRTAAQGNGSCDDAALTGHRSRCEEAMARCFPLGGGEASRGMHARLSRQWCGVMDCRLREEQRRHSGEHLPVAVLLIFMAFACFLAFCLAVTCVDNSDDILAALLESRLASAQCVRRVRRARETTRVSVGMERTRQI